MKKPEETSQETIVGMVTASQVDEDDRIMGITISTEDDEYEVEMSSMGEELLDFLDEEVEVSGLVYEERDGTKWITVTGYEVMYYDDDEESDEGYDDDLDLEDLDFDNIEDQHAY